jgi:hypothetical protein
MNRASFVPAFAGATLAFLLGAACGSSVLTTGSGGTGGGTTTTGPGGGTTTTGTGDTTTSTTSTGSSTTSSSTGSSSSTSGTPGVCGGKTGQPCGPDEYCLFAPGAACGVADGTGHCKPRPTSCTPSDCPGVCGCDGVYYCDSCLASQAGVDVHACALADETYGAQTLFTDVPRFLILKYSVSNSRCFQLLAEPSVTPGGGVAGDGWAITLMRETDNVNDCIFPPGPIPPPLGDTFDTMEASGVLSFTTSPAGCMTGIHATADFSAGPAWGPVLEPFDADALVIQGGCP